MKYATIAEPDPVILTKPFFEDFSKKCLISFNFGNLDKEIVSRELLSFFKLSKLNIFLEGLLNLGFENFLTLEYISFVEHPKLGLTISA